MRKRKVQPRVERRFRRDYSNTNRPRKTILSEKPGPRKVSSKLGRTKTLTVAVTIVKKEEDTEIKSKTSLIYENKSTNRETWFSSIVHPCRFRI